MRFLLLVVFFSILLLADGEAIYKKKCSSCHINYIPMKELKENFMEYNNTRLKLKAPTINQLSYRLKEMIGDRSEDQELHEFEVREFIKDYVVKPSKEKSLCHKKVLAVFKTMHSMEGQISESELIEVSKYIYNYDKADQKGSKNIDKNIDKILLQAKKENKLILIDVDSENCYYCKKMQKDVLSKGDVKEYLTKNFIVLNIDVSKQELPLGLKYSVTPTYFFLDEKAKVIKIVPGAWSKEEFLEILQTIKGYKK